MTEVLITCEHGGNRVPRAYRHLFAGRQRVLASHRGWDPGAIELARYLARSFGVSPLLSQVTRLLVDLNRSPGHPRVFSEVTRGLPVVERQRLLERYHQPHREAVRERVTSGSRVVHIAVHSFASTLRGETRRADIGLLYDPQRKFERGVCADWKAALNELAPELRVRRNYPYRGVDDGLTTWLRAQCSTRRYAGIELEINQRLATGPRATALARTIVASLREIGISSGAPNKR